MKRYVLRKGVYLVKGAFNGALLDTNTGNVFSVNEASVSVLTNETNNTDYWVKLFEADLAEEITESTSTHLLPKIKKITLGFVWFEILSDDCNESCIHCYAESMPTAHRKAIGLDVKVTETRQKLTFTNWCDLIYQSYQLGCRKCQFIGGEPFLYRHGDKTVLDLAEYAVGLGFEYVEIFSNATLLNPEKISRIKSLGVRMAVSLYSSDADIHDSITQTPGSFLKTIKNLQLLKQAGVKTRVETVIMKQNEKTINGTQILIKDIGFSGKSPDPLRPKGRGDNKSIRPSTAIVAQYGYKLKPSFTAEKTKVAHYSTGHSCLAGKITITDSGDVLPCIFSRNHSIGNVVSQNLEEVVLSTAIQQIWNTTKDNVLVCQDCEYRYVCFDCRPLSEAAAMGNSDFLHAPFPRCTYNPYTGEWAQGIWRVSEGGDAWYDRTIGPVLQEVVSLKSIPIIQPEGH
jgi:radical SAM protein with 4Fe4S-binding SPASM domain